MKLLNQSLNNMSLAQFNIQVVLLGLEQSMLECELKVHSSMFGVDKVKAEKPALTNFAFLRELNFQTVSMTWNHLCTTCSGLGLHICDERFDKNLRVLEIHTCSNKSGTTCRES